MGNEATGVMDMLRLRDETMKKRAIEAFANHRIRARSDGRWLLMQQLRDGGHAPDIWDSNMCADVLIGYTRHIYVGGDIQSVVFGYGPRDERSRLAWIGGTDDVSYYVAQKASIGMTSRDAAHEFDREIAEAALREMLDEYVAEYGDDAAAAAVGDILGSMPDNADQLARELHDVPGSWFCEDTHDIGSVTSPSVYYAWAAVRKLHLLLTEEEALVSEGRETA